MEKIAAGIGPSVLVAACGRLRERKHSVIRVVPIRS